MSEHTRDGLVAARTRQSEYGGVRAIVRIPSALIATDIEHHHLKAL